MKQVVCRTLAVLALVAAGTTPVAAQAPDTPALLAAQRQAMLPLAALDGQWRGTARIFLPDGKTLRLWEAWERHLADEDDHTDLSYAELVDIGIHYDTLSTAFEET